MATRQSAAVLQQFGTLFDAGTAVGLDDGQLLERFVDRRDEAAFAALLARHGPLVLGTCRRLLANPADVEDAFQATFLVMVRKASSLRDRRLLSTWLYKVAYRVALRARAETNRQTACAPARVASPPAADLERREVREVIDEEILRLPRRYRGPVVLCYLEGLNHQEAARRLGCPLGTVNSRLAAARVRLRVRLNKRGLAPSAVLMGATSLPEFTKAAVPAPLLQITSSAALRIANGSAIAGTARATVIVLTEGSLRAMITSKLKLAAVGSLAAVMAVAGLGLLSRGAPGEQQSSTDVAIAAPVPDLQNNEPEPAAQSDQGSRGEEVTVPVTGTVLMPDGSPAVGATVEAMNGPGEPPIVARANDAGRFQLHGVFGNSGLLHASSADGKHQTLLVVSSAAVRTAFASPIELSLAPTLTHEVTVLSGGHPVEGAHVVGVGRQSKVRGVTGGDGKIQLRIPAKEGLYALVAWHPKLGVSGAREHLDDRLRQGTIQMSLISPKSHSIRVDDVDGKPIGGLELGLSVRTEDSDWIVADTIEASHVRTDAQGTATVPWAPRDKLKIVNVEILSPDWKIEKTDLERVREGITTIHASRRRQVDGRLVMPGAASAFGLLITGFGIGGKGFGDIPHARARSDGTFTLRISSGYFYTLQIDDTQWAGDRWSGEVLGKDMREPAKIIINAYPATPLTIRVARGPRRDPVVNAWVEVSSVKDSVANISRWFWTDAQGVARTGVGKGEQKVTLRLDPWTEERTIQVASTEPVEVEFHRPWQGDRHVMGRLLLDAARYTPSATLVALAWTPQGGRPPLEFQAKVRPDGTFEVAFDAETLSLLFIDPTRQRSGFVRVGRADSTAEVTMVPTATYSGTLLDEKSQPLSGRTLQLDVETARRNAVPARRTDEAGRFRFEGVPAQVPLRLLIRNEQDGPEYDLGLGGDRLFEPGEVRENDHVRARRIGPAATVVRPSVPLAQRIENLCLDARLNGMYALVILQGDESQDVVAAAGHLVDPDRVRVVLKYLTLRVEPAQLKTEAATLARYGWPLPALGEIVLVALNGDQKTIADQRVTAGNPAEALSTGEDFLKQHMPPNRNACRLLAEARKEAKGSGRRVWIVYGGARCAPCFGLARWMEDHHATLEKDFVTVKVMDGIDRNVDDVITELPWKRGDGIPWFAITQPDGTVLATSNSPLGNIGFPDSVEGIRHFRTMLDRTVRAIKSDEVERLVKSLSAGAPKA
jgi:RNA polymerase sigma factor (sigma-70 family)